MTGQTETHEERVYLLADCPPQMFDQGASPADFVDCHLKTKTPLEKLTRLRITSDRARLPRRNCTISVGEQSPIVLRAFLHGDGGQIEFGNHVTGSYITKSWDASRIEIGTRTTSNHVEIWADHNAIVQLGKDCLIAHQVTILGGDMHGIFDVQTLEKINEVPGHIVIGDHVWLGREVLILKAGSIGAGSIIAARSLVAGAIGRCCLAVGSPAKVQRENVSWTRSPRFDGMEGVAKFLSGS